MDLPNSGIPSASWVSPPIVNMKGHSLYSTTGTTQLCTQMAKLIYISAPLFYNFPQSTFTQKTAFPIHNVSVDLRGITSDDQLGVYVTGSNSLYKQPGVVPPYAVSTCRR
jgi:hypothetical protein